jgi:hypothetical protein
VEFFRSHPFFGLNEDRIRMRAYHLSRSPESSGWLGDWLEAEWRELVEGLGRYASFYHLGAEPGPDEFVDLYRPLVSYAFSYDEQKEVMIGSRDQRRRCTLCGLTKPTVRFKSAAHVIPQALGNKCLKTRDECDDCNNLYGRTHDRELAEFLRPELTLARVHGQGGPKKYSLGSGRSSIGGADRADPVPIAIREDDSSFSIVYTDSGFTINTPGVTFSPMNAMKSIGRATWHVLSSEAQAKHRDLCQWIRGEIDAKPMHLFHSFIPLTALTKVGMVVWESRSASSHSLVTMMFTGHSLLVLYLPGALEAGNAGVQAFPPMPAMIPPLKLDEIIATNSDRITTQNSSINVVVAGDSFPLSVGERYPVTLVATTMQWNAELEVDGIDDANARYKLRYPGIVLDIAMSRKNSNVGMSLIADLSSVPISDAVVAIELLCLLHEGTPITVGVDAGKGPSRLFTLGNAPDPAAAEPWRNSLELARAIARLATHLGTPLIYPEHPDQEATRLLNLDQIVSTGQLVVATPSTVNVTLSPAQLPSPLPGNIFSFSVPSASLEVQGRSIQLGTCHIELVDARLVNELQRPDGLLDVEIECSSLIQRYSNWAPSDGMPQQLGDADSDSSSAAPVPR